jgi:hypothetical protein
VATYVVSLLALVLGLTLRRGKSAGSSKAIADQGVALQNLQKSIAEMQKAQQGFAAFLESPYSKFGSYGVRPDTSKRPAGPAGAKRPETPKPNTETGRPGIYEATPEAGNKWGKGKQVR